MMSIRGCNWTFKIYPEPRTILCDCGFEITENDLEHEITLLLDCAGLLCDRHPPTYDNHDRTLPECILGSFCNIEDVFSFGGFKVETAPMRHSQKVVPISIDLHVSLQRFPRLLLPDPQFPQFFKFPVIRLNVSSVLQMG